MPVENALFWCWSLSGLSGKLPPALRNAHRAAAPPNSAVAADADDDDGDNATARFEPVGEPNTLAAPVSNAAEPVDASGARGRLQYQQRHQQRRRPQAHQRGQQATAVNSLLQTEHIRSKERSDQLPHPVVTDIDALLPSWATHVAHERCAVESAESPAPEAGYFRQSIYSRFSCSRFSTKERGKEAQKQHDPQQQQQKLDQKPDDSSPATAVDAGGATGSPAAGEAVYESIITLDPFEMISMAHLNQQLHQQQQPPPAPPPQPPAAVHIVANPMGQDSLYTTIGDVSERVYECPDECPPPVPPKQMEVLYTKPTKVFLPKSIGGAALKIYRSRETVPASPTRDPSSTTSEARDLYQENFALKQEILAYRERMKALATKLEQFDGISAIVEELQEKVDKVSQENARLRSFEREQREAQEQLREAQRQYKLDVDQLSSQVALLDSERSDLECSLAKLREEHDCLMISSQNSVSFQYHSQAMLEVKRLLEELKNKYQNDKEALLLRVEAAEQEKAALKASATQLEEETAALRAERDQLSTNYRKAVRQKQSLVHHIKELQSEDSEMHALMQSLLKSAHQAVAERDTLERLVKPPRPAATSGGPEAGAARHQPAAALNGQTALDAQKLVTNGGEWIGSDQNSFLSC